jgi:hypothetical protein
MMIYYAPTILKGVGFGPSGALLSSMGMAGVYPVMTAIALTVVDRVGRRRLSLLMISGATVSLLALGTLFMLGMAGSGQAWRVVGCLLIYMAFNAGGLQVVGGLTGSEVCPLSVRGAGTSAQAGVVRGADLLVTATALTLVAMIGAGGTMWMDAAMNVLAFVFIRYLVPETAGQSLEEIEGALREDWFRPSRGINITCGCARQADDGQPGAWRSIPGRRYQGKNSAATNQHADHETDHTGQRQCHEWLVAHQRRTLIGHAAALFGQVLARPSCRIRNGCAHPAGGFTRLPGHVGDRLRRTGRPTGWASSRTGGRGCAGRGGILAVRCQGWS